MMDKNKLKQLVIAELSHQLEIAVASADAAHSTATHTESVAENKYDTFGLEASYLAQGQSERVAQLKVELEALESLVLKPFDDDTPIDVGALVTLEDDNGMVQTVFVAPSAGGIKVKLDHCQIVVVTPQAPLGAALKGQYSEDEIRVGDAANPAKTIVSVV